MSDRFEIPATLEKALEFAKQQPSNRHLGAKKVRDWDVIVKRGQRSLFWAKWKPVTAALASAAVVMAIVVSPISPFGGSAQLNNEPTLTSGAFVGGDLTTEEMQERRMMYAQQGYTLLYATNEFGIDIVKNKQAVFAVKAGQMKQLVTLEGAQKAEVQERNTLPYALLSISSGDVRDPDQLHLLNMQDLSIKLIERNTTGFNLGTKLVTNPAPTLYYLQVDANGKTSTMYRQDLVTGKEEVLHQGNEIYEQFLQNGETFAFGTGNKIILQKNDGKAKTIVQIEGRKMQLLDVREGKYVLYETGLKDRYDSTFSHSYNTERALMQYDVKSGQTRELLPNVDGEPYLILASSENGVMVVGNFIMDQGADKNGKMQLWEVYEDGREPRLLHERPAVWGNHWVMDTWTQNKEHVFYQVDKQWVAIYDESKSSVEVLNEGQAKKILK